MGIPCHLRVLRERPRTNLPELLAITRQSARLKREDDAEAFDAQTWRAYNPPRLEGQPCA